MKGRSLYQSAPWFELLAAHGLPEVPADRLAWPLCGPDGQRLGEIPLMLASSSARFHQGLSSCYSPSFGPCWLDGDASMHVDWAAAAAWLKGQRGLHTLRLQPFVQDAPWVSALKAGLSEAGFACGWYACAQNWIEPLADSLPNVERFASYWMSRPSRLRNTLKRAQRKLSQMEGVAIDIVTVPGPALDQAMAAFQAIYADSWKGAEPCPSFMPGLMAMAASRGWLRLGVLSIQGVPVASQVWLVHSGQADIYKLAQRPGHEALSIGTVLQAALMAHVIDVDQVSMVDFLTGDDRYKRDWMTECRPLVGLVVFRWWDWRCWPGWASHGLGRMRRRLKDGLNRLRPARPAQDLPAS